MYYLEKIKKHLVNWKDYFKEHLIRVIFISLLCLLFGFILTIFPKALNNGEQEIFLLGISLSNWSIWIGIIGILFTAIWALYEYDNSRISKQQEKASEIAKHFSDDLLTKCGLVIAVFQNSPLKNLLCQLNTLNSPFRHFTTDELREITDNDDCPSLYKREKSKIDFDEIYFQILKQRISVFPQKKDSNNQKNNKLKKFTTYEARKLFILDNASLPFHFSSLVDDVLNNLEYACMNISSNAAGSPFIYQSLHQMFFDTINILAFEISIRNDGKYSDKFYTNVIYVYNEWQKLYKKSRKNESLKKNHNKETLNPKIKTVE